MATSNTRTAILDTAERLFASVGFDATSVREITREAGVNVAAIHYHFGSKEAVLRGVTDRVVTSINNRRIELLADLLRREGDLATPYQILEVFIRPDIEALKALHRRGPTVAHFLGRLYLDQTPWIQHMTMEQFAPAAVAFFPVLAQAIPHLDTRAVALRMSRVGIVLAHAFATWPAAGVSDGEAEEMLAELVSFCTAGLTAPIHEPAR